jgi:hypothetical protein
MIRKWLKDLWENLTDSKFVLVRIVTPLAGVFFTWGFFGHLYTINLEREDLRKISGKVEWIGVRTETAIGRSPRKYHPLNILLAGHDESFRLIDHFKYHFERIQDSVRFSDNVTIYARTKMQTLFGWGRQADIYALDKGDKSIFSVEQMNNFLEEQMYGYGAFAFICWFLYAMDFYERAREKRGSR